MLIRLTRRPCLLSLGFVVILSVAALVAGFALKASAQEAASPTISSDKADYPPGGSVILTGAGWQPGESVNIFVNDDVGKTWSHNADVTADESGQIRDEFQLPNWFVAQYSVRATGARSGVATASFTDANPDIQLQGQSKPPCTSGPSCDTTTSPANYQVTALDGWQELDVIPLRLRFNKGGTFSNIKIDFDHFQTSSGATNRGDRKSTRLNSS